MSLAFSSNWRQRSSSSNLFPLSSSTAIAFDGDLANGVP